MTDILSREKVFVWDFPSLCQHRRIGWFYLYTRAKCLSRGLYQRISTCFLGAFNLQGEGSRLPFRHLY